MKLPRVHNCHQELRVGVAFAIDDFRTGCSSLSYLRAFQLMRRSTNPIDGLKGQTPRRLLLVSACRHGAPHCRRTDHRRGIKRQLALLQGMQGTHCDALRALSAESLRPVKE